MKFGETGDSIYATSFSVEEGYSTPAWPFDQAIKILEAIDGTIIDVINFGAREHRTAEFKINYATRANHYAVKTYLEANLGKKIRIELENAGERVFGEQLPGPVFYAYLLKVASTGESRFSPTHTMYGFSLSLDYAGPLSTSVPNAADTSQYDFLIKMDCARITAGCQVTDLTALNAITTKPGGSRGLTTSNLKVYFYNKANSTWEYQYTLPANDPAQGLKYGVFRLSAFSDISGSSSGIGGEAFKSGWIGKRGIKFPRYSVDARNGPAVEIPEAFSFSIDNSAKRWKYPLDNNLAFYGAYCELYAYDRQAGVLQLMRSGYNNRSTFDYDFLNFEVEPGVLQNKSFPVTTIGKDNFPNADAALRGKPVLATYGRFDKGEVQTVSFNMDPIRFPSGMKLLNVLNWNSSTKALDLDLGLSEVTTILGYVPTSGAYPATLYQFLYVAIFAQQNQADLNQLRKVTAVASNSGKARFTLDAGFKNVLDTTALMVVYLSTVQILIDDDAVVGMQAAGYLKTGSPDGTLPLELYGKEGDVVSTIPDLTFKLIDDGKKGQITVDTNHIALSSPGDLITSDSTQLENLPGSSLHTIVDKTHANGYGYFDFGFSPKGVESNEISVKPFPRVLLWGDSGTPSRNLETKWSASLVSGSEYKGKVVVVYSKFFSTIIWTAFFGATGYRITRNISRWVNAAQSYQSFLDPTFGGGAGVELSDGSAPHSITAGVVEISGGTSGIGDGDAFVLIDKSVSNTETGDYYYTLEPLVNNQTQNTIYSNNGKNRSVPQGAKTLVGLGKHSSVVLAWQVPDDQVSYTINKDGTDLGGMPVASATKGWHEVTGLTDNQEYKFKVSINCLAVGSSGDTWFLPALTTKDQSIHQLLKPGDPYVALPYKTLRDPLSADLTTLEDSDWVTSWGAVTVNRTNDGLDLPAAAVVYSWLWKIDREKHLALKDMGGATDVRLLGDFVVRSWKDDNTPVPIIIQLRGLRADKSTAFTIQYSNLTCKAAAESPTGGAYAIFRNLPGQKNGSGSDVNYDTEANAANADALYTGKDLWRLPDYLFEDGGLEWSKIEYFMFSITNAEAIPFFSVAATGYWAGHPHPGYHMGIGGPPGKTWGMVQYHKPDLYIECLRKFDGGLRKPLYTRIDGGKVDDASGTATGTPSKIIEKARHVVNDVIYSLTGKLPVYIGKEMKSRDSWIWRWQAKDSKPMAETLQMLMRNIWGIATLTPDDNICIRTLDIDDSNNTPVYAFTPSNIIADSFKKPEGRRRSEIFQKFLLKYNIEPSQDGAATEEMTIGWDQANSKAIFGGYARTVEDSTGILSDLDSLDKSMVDRIKASIQLYAAGVAINEFGTDPDNAQIFEMFYRPTKASKLTGLPIEKDLPNLDSLWSGTAYAPKIAMQALFKMVVNFYSLDAWYFSFSCSMKNLIYNTGVTGVKDEAGTADNRLKLGDLVTVQEDFFTNGQAVKGFILDIENSSLYDGYATLHVFAPRPPGQFGPGVDGLWDAGAPGARNENNFLFSGNLYGLISESGTFADAGAPGARNPSNMTFPDGSFADAKGTGSGKA